MGHGHDYMDSPGDPLYSFGHGLSYTSFEYSNLLIRSAADGKSCEVSYRITNIGNRSGAEVVQLYVRDTGMGIAPEDIPHLFQKFYRIDNSDTRTIGGTGLGLFLSRMIIEQSNGKIWVTSEPGKGSTFYINLPRLSTTEATSRKAQASTTQTPTMVQ